MAPFRSWTTNAVVLLAIASSARGQTLGFSAAPPIASAVPPATQTTAQQLSLDQVVAIVLTADPRLRVGSEEINMAIADSVTASLRPNPTVGLDGQLLPLTRPFTPQEQGGPPQFDALVSYPIDWFLFGKRKAAMASAAIGVQATESEYYDLIRLRIRETSLLFFDVLELKALRDVARQDVENFAKVEEATRQAVKNGGRPEVDLSRIRLDLLRSQQLLRDADVALNTAKAKLRAVMGRADDFAFDVVGSLDLPQETSLPNADEAMQMAQENRPDLIALRQRVAKAEADRLVEDRKAFPTVAAKGGYSRQFQGSIGFRDADTFMVGVDLGLPVFDRNQGNRARASTAIAQSQYRVQASQVEVRSEIEQTLYEVRVARQSVQAVASDQLKLAEHVRDSINKANEAGGRPLIDVLDAQRNYRDTFRLYVSSRASYWRANVRLNAALGKKVCQ